MASLAKLSWNARRLSRMTPPELAHRLGERLRMHAEARHPADWAGFGDFGGPILALPGVHFSRATPAMVEIAAEEARNAKSGVFDYLGQAWPPLGEGWETKASAWTLDPVIGSAWPGAGVPWARVNYRHADRMGDVKYVWELNRLPFLGAVGLAAAKGDDAAARFAYRALEGWMAANPPFDGVHWTSGIEAASRLVSVLWLFACAPPPSPDDERRLRAFLHAHGKRLARYPSLYSSANNHRVAELAGLFLLSLCAPGLAGAAAWAEEGRAGLEAEIGRQFHADGVGAEQSPAYAAYSLEWFALAGVAAEAAGRPLSPGYRQTAATAAEHLRWMLDAGGRTLRIGDDDEGRVLTLRQAPEERHVASVVALVRRWSGEPPLDPALHDPDLRDLSGPAPAAGPPVEAPLGLHAFTGGGLTVAREATPQGPSLLLFDHGPLGFLSIAAHGHADALAVTLAWGEEPVLVDPGTYLYHAGDAARDRLRGTAAHNTLSIEGADQSRIIGAFAWDRHAETRLVEQTATSVQAEHHGYRARFGVIHRRRVAMLGGGAYDITDILIGPPSRELGWTAGFTLAPGCTASLQGGVATVATPAGKVATLSASGDLSGGWQVGPAEYSPRFSHLEPTQRLLLAGRMQRGVARRNIAVRLQLGER